MSQFLIEDRFTVPANMAAAHATMPQQSINVLNAACTEENRLIRLFLGTVYISHIESKKRWKQAVNYSVLGCPTVKIRSYHGIEKLLLEYDISATELDRHLRETLKQRKYYGELLGEVCNSLWRTERGEHTLAFLHLYRFLEHISFAFPLLYAARTSDFSGSFSALKDFFSGADKGELNFFRKFVEASIDSETLEQTTTIKIDGVRPERRAAVFGAIKRQIPSNLLMSETLDYELQFENSAILGLCINLRNRFFHYSATNSENISVNSIGDSDTLFECVNQAILNWLAVLYFETLRHRVRAL